MTTTISVPVLIIGAGPAGLRAARELAPHIDGEVLVLDREAEPGESHGTPTTRGMASETWVGC